MDINIIHKEIIIHLFLIILTIKVVLLVINKEKFQVMQAKGKWVEMILGPAILISGLAAWIIREYPPLTTWIWVKLILMLAGIGIIIVSFKKLNKPMAIFGLALFIFIYLLALKRVEWGLV